MIEKTNKNMKKCEVTERTIKQSAGRNLLEEVKRAKKNSKTNIA